MRILLSLQFVNLGFRLNGCRDLLCLKKMQRSQELGEI